MSLTEQANLARISHKYFGDKKPFDVIYDNLTGKRSKIIRKYLYHFKNVSKYKISYENKDLDIVYGELYKTKLSYEHEVLEDQETLNYVPQIDDERFSVNRFLIFEDLSIVFTSNARLNSDQFVEVFEDLYHENCRDLVPDIRIQYRKRDIDIFERINLFSRLLKVELLKIRKSNPSPKPTFKKIEDFLKREQVDVYTGKFESESSTGLARDQDSHIMSGISIANAGYGGSIIFGQNKDGSVEIINIKDNIVRKRIQKIPFENQREFIMLVLINFYKEITGTEDLVYD
jgi:hypothetical protein